MTLYYTSHACPFHCLSVFLSAGWWCSLWLVVLIFLLVLYAVHVLAGDSLNKRFCHTNCVSWPVVCQLMENGNYSQTASSILQDGGEAEETEDQVAHPF